MTFKNLAKKQFNCVKMQGMYELNIKPVELILTVTFSTAPTEASLKISKSEFENRLKRKLSLVAIENAVHQLNLESVKFEGARFTFEHDWTQVSQKSKLTSLGIDLYFVTIKPVSSTEYASMCEKISLIQPFQSDELLNLCSNKKAWKATSVPDLK